MAASAPQDLWETAIDYVDLQVKDRLAPTKTLVRDIVYEVLKEAKARHNDSVKKRLRLPNGIIVRDVMEKIMHWVNCFKEVGDSAVQFDPEHAALPWAAIRFILQGLVNYSEVEREILEDIELIARLLAIFRGIEKFYLGPDAIVELRDALVRAYIAILETLANAVKLLGESKKAKLLKAPFRVPGKKNISSLLAHEHEVFSFTHLVDGDRVSQMMVKLERLTERSTIADIAVENEKHRAVLEWLSKTNYRDHHRDLSGMRLTGTGNWLSKHAEYISWQQRSSCSTLAVHGIPGCGKTILCSMVIDELMQSSSSTQSASSTQVKEPVAYFYCSATASEPDRRDFTNILRSLLRQLTIGSSQTQRIHTAVLAAYDARLEEARKDGFDIRPLDAAESETVILNILEDNPATFIIDAIDEMDDPQGLLHSLQTICSKSKNILKVLVSSRDNPLILSTSLAAHHIRVTTNDNHSDVHKFITQRVEKLIERRKMPQSVRDETILSLSAKAGEMFQWAKLQLAQLEFSQDPLIGKDFEEKLSELATSTLEGLYGAIFGVIMQYKETARQMATHTFSWLLFACEPLNLDMLLAATAGAAGWETPTPEGFLEICHGFVYVDSQSNVVRLVHESVREFLLSQPSLQPQLGQTLISLSCLKILENPPPDDVTQLHPADEQYDYATLYVGQHLSLACSGSAFDAVSQKLETFLFDGEDVSVYADIWLTTVKATCDALPHDHPQKVAMSVIVSDSYSPIFPICAFGLLSVLETHHWPPGFDWNQTNSHNHTALYLAANFGHAAVVSFLLDQLADPNMKCGIFGTASQCAAYRGHDTVVEILADRGADLKLPGKFESVLHAACNGGHEKVATKLLDSRLEFTTQSEYDIATAEVAKAGFAQALDKLQAHPLSNTLTSDKVQQQAGAAIVNGKLSVLKRLISRSSFDLVVAKGSLALSAVHGHEDIAKLLIANGVDVDEPGHLGTPLRCASVCGHNNVCRLLLDHGADINANARFGPALHAAAMRGHLHTAKFLLDKGADVNAQGGHYGTSMQAAAYHGHVELVNLFLNAKADVLIPGLFQDALHAAIEGGRENIVRAFLDAGLQGPTYKWTYSVPAWGHDKPLLRPGNILRESSPSRHLTEPAAATKLYDRLGDSEDDRDERGDATNIECDSFGSAHAPFAHKIRREPGRQRAKHNKQGLLEIAAARGHLTVVRLLLLESRSFVDVIEASIALVAACRHGQRDVVCGLLESIPIRSDCTIKAFAAASVCHDNEIMQILMSALDKLEGPEIVQFLPELLLSCVPDDPFLFGHTLQRVLADGSEHFVESTLVSCLCVVARAGWSRDLKIMLEHLNLTTENIVIAFEAAFDAGRAATVSMLQNLLTEDIMTVRQYNGFARLAAQAGNTELFECMLPRTDFSGATQHVEHMIYCAAGSGHLGILTTLTSQDWTSFYSKEALTKALLIAARNGHYDIATYLVSMGAEACQFVIEPRDGDVLERKASVYRYFDILKESSSTVYSLQPHKGDARQSRQLLEPSGDAIERRTDPVSEPQCNAIEACLAGYERFSVDNNIPDESKLPWQPTDESTSPWQLADEPTHARTMAMLLDQCTDLEGPQWTDVICKAFAICSPEMLDLMLAKGADPHAANETTSALICAAGRSTSTLAAVQALVSAATDTAFGEAELRTALDAATSLFHESNCGKTMYDDYHGSTLFPMYDTIEDIFVSGPGAVIKYVLRILPQETARGDRYSLCLQMAAAADNYEIVRLLLQRGVDCNAVVGYYGTALKAACRLGHSAIVALLLDFGADHTIVNVGAFYTALQAAVMARSLSCVQALLDHGANNRLTTSTTEWSFFQTQATALSLAMKARLASISVLLIKAGAYTEEESCLEQPLLIEACSWGETSVVRSLLQSGADVRVLGTKDFSTGVFPRQYGSALHAAIEFGHVHLVELLVAHGLELTADCGTAGHPLEYAAAKGNIFVMATLLKLCPLHSGKPFVEAVQSAILHSHHDMAKMICEYARVALTAHDLLLLCKTPNSTSECSIIWFLLERLRQLNGSAGQFAEAVRHAIRHGQPATALQLFTHAEKFLLSREIWSILLEQGCLRSSRQFVLLLIETLQGRDDFDLKLETASAGVAGVRPEHVETLLSYVPCTHAIFIEACTRGDEKVVRIGLSQGLAIDEDVGMQRPALHFAAAHGRTEIVKMLLKEQSSSDGNHKEYGTAMEAVLMSCEARFLLWRDSLSEKEARYLQDLIGLNETDHAEPFIDDPQIRAARNEIVRLLLVHRSHACSSKSASGSTLLELSLAMYLGWHDVFHQLLEQGTPAQFCRSVLPSPLVLAIGNNEGNSLEMVKKMLELDKTSPGISWYDPEGCALHQACRHAKVPIVQMLLARGYSFAHENGENQSALTVCLEELARGSSYLWAERVSIAHTLLDSDPAASISDGDIVAACDLSVSAEQEAILQSLFARREQSYIPEEGIVRVLSAELPRDGGPDRVMPWQRLFEERRIEKVTTNLFAGVGSVEVVTKLLDYDQSYIISAETIDLIGTRSRGYSGLSVLECIGKLLDRCPNTLPTESNILRVLDAGSNHDASSVLDSLFCRNPTLNVTEQMLKSCRNPVNLSWLLSRENTGGQGLVLSLIGALVDEIRDLALCRMENPNLPARLAVLLDHAPRAKLSGKVIECILGSSHLGNIERILDRHPDASLTSDNISVMIEAPRELEFHRDVVDFLRKHHGRYSMSDVRLAVGRIQMPLGGNDLRVTKLYHDLNGW